MENMWKNGVYMEGWSSTKPLRRIPAQGWLIPLSEFLGKDPAPDLKNQILSPYGKQMLLPLRSKTENNPMIENGKFKSAFCFCTIIVNSRDISISRQQCIVRRRSAPKLNSNADFLEKEAFSIDYSLRSCTKERNVQIARLRRNA